MPRHLIMFMRNRHTISIDDDDMELGDSCIQKNILHTHPHVESLVQGDLHRANDRLSFSHR